MAFDPTKPQELTPLDAGEIRNQFVGLKQLIDDLPASTPMTDAIVASAAGPLPAPAILPPLDLIVSNPPTQAEVQAIVDYLFQLHTALSRT